jgi:hypothetical protein
MSLELLDASETDDGIVVTFGTERGLERLEGSSEEIAQLARAMQQVAALGQLNEHEHVWVEEVAVGRSIVKLGLSPGGQARVLIVHDARLDLEA